MRRPWGSRGAGLAASYRRLLFDARVAYRQTCRNDLLRADDGRLNTRGLNGNVGVEF